VVVTAVETTGHVVPRSVFARGDGSRPVLVVDLGVPRNVDPDAAQVDGVTLLDMDDLRADVQRALDERRAEADRAAVLVDEEMARYRMAHRARAAAPVVAALRTRLEELRLAELERRRRALPAEAFERADEVTRAVLAKLLHEPTVALKESAGTPRGERLVEALRALFDL
jgi:glutamyl-tRNA reductase